MIKRSRFGDRRAAYAFLMPQALILGFFFYWPSVQAFLGSLYLVDPWGGGDIFVGFENFTRLFDDPAYVASVERTAVFTFGVAGLALSAGLILAAYADRVIRGRGLYQNLLIWPYAIAPVVAGAFWLFLLDPFYGMITTLALKPLGVDWNPFINGPQAMLMMVLAVAWKNIAYNFVFFLAALQSVPRSVVEAAAIDGAGPARRFWTILFPLISPTAFFLLVVNLVNAFFDGFSLIHAMTQGGPSGATTIMIYKVYRDGFVGLDLGSSSAQSVILMVVVIALTVVQFRYLERRIAYA